MTQSTLRALGAILIILAAVAVLDAMELIRFRSRLIGWMDDWGCLLYTSDAADE